MFKIILATFIILILTVPASAQRGGWGHGGWHRDRWHGGGGFAGGVVGGIIGGVIGGMMAPRAPEPVYDPVQECMRRFRSYNPETGYYRSYDGAFRPCP